MVSPHRFYKPFLSTAVVVLLALIPLYGILIPPLADLPQQILVNKLLWEKLSGASQLDLEISKFIGYRLSSFLIVVLITLLNLGTISLIYLPKAIVTALISIHAVSVTTVLNHGVEERSWETHIAAACFELPAVVAMYSASWFIGFIGFTLSITLLIPAIFFTERFVHSGKRIDAFWLFLALLLVYASHPFALTFWMIWVFGRCCAAVATRSVKSEWRNLLLLGVIVLPIFGYHFLAMSVFDLAQAGQSSAGRFPFVSPGDWYQNRLLGFFDGTYLKADETSDARVFSIFAICLFIVSAIVAFVSKREKFLRKPMLAAIVFVVVASWIDEKFFPVPEGHWLAYDYRFMTAALVLCLGLAGMVLVRSFQLPIRRSSYRTALLILGMVSVLASVEHLLSVRKAYARFDVPAREYVARILDHELPNGIDLPRSRWYPDGTYLRRYVCLEQPDCNPAGTLFRNLGGDIYPVKLRSKNRILAPGAVPVDVSAEPVDAVKGGEGYGGGQFSKPRGIAVERGGDFYVADTGNNRMQKFDSAGNFLFAFGRPGSGEGEFTTPSGVAVDSSDNVYVTDTVNNKLMRFGPDGKFVKEWTGSDPGFFMPGDIAAGYNGQLYIVDQGRARIVIFDPETEKYSAWGTSGSDAGQFRGVTGIEVSEGYVFVADLGNNRVQVFDLDGKFVRQWVVEPWDRYVWNYADIAYDERSDRFYLSNGWRKEVLVYDASGKFLESLKLVAPAELNNASSLVVSVTAGGRRLLVLNTGSDAFDAGEPKISVFELP